MEVAVELEDDLFFADLSKQISLLIMDDDNDGDENPVASYPSVSFQAFTTANYPISQSPFLREQICRRESSKGTGVFIPKSSLPRRKRRQGRRYGSLSSKSNRQLDNSTTMASQTSYNNSSYPRRG